jgi:hypothetical protein
MTYLWKNILKERITLVKLWITEIHHHYSRKKIEKLSNNMYDSL